MKLTLISVLTCTLLFVNGLFAQDLHTPIACTAGQATTPLNFASGGYYDWDTPGTLSKTYTDVGFSGHDVTISITGETQTLGLSPGSGLATPTLDNALSPGAETLSFLTSGIGNGNRNITFTIQFSPPIPGELGFELYHINRSGSGDRIQVTAQTHLGGNLNPVYTPAANPSYALLGQNTVNATTFTSLEDGQLGINFSSPDSISTVTVIWRDCSGCPSATHGLAIGNFDFCRRLVDSDGDGVEERIDVDDDNDGITDAMEACGQSYLNPDQDTVSVEITLDDFPQETTWQLEDFYGNVLAFGGPYANPDDIGQVFTTSVVVDADMPTVFRIYDSYGDALTGGSNGNYRILRNGATIVGPVTSNWGASTFEAIAAIGAPYDPFSCLGSDYGADDDMDGVLNFQDPDFCTLNAAGVCSSLDSDGDGVIDPYDLDTDNDGIRDDIEGQGTPCYQVPSAIVDSRGLPINFVSYVNCADNSTALSYGIIPNDDSDDADQQPDYRDLDTDGDGLADFTEGFDFNLDGRTVDDYTGFAATFAASGGSVVVYDNTIDSDNDRIPDWLDNLPFAAGYTPVLLPPFQTPGNLHFADTDSDGIVDLFDTDNGGTVPNFPPDNDADGNPDWRDIDNNISLPVEFAGFSVVLREQRDGDLQWNTSSETGLSHFEVFRSSHGLSFQSIGSTPAFGDSEILTHYEFRDEGVTLDLEDIAFYRIHAVDVDGSVTLSEIQVLHFGAGRPDIDFKVFPNPASDLVTIQLTGLEQGKVQLSLCDLAGRQLWSEADEARYFMQWTQSFVSLKRGMYFLMLDYQGQRETRKLILK